MLQVEGPPVTAGTTCKFWLRRDPNERGLEDLSNIDVLLFYFLIPTCINAGVNEILGALRKRSKAPRVACRALQLFTQFKADEEAVGNLNADFLLNGKCIFNLGVGTADCFSVLIRSLF